MSDDLSDSKKKLNDKMDIDLSDLRNPPSIRTCLEEVIVFLNDKSSQVFTLWVVAAPILLVASTMQGLVMDSLGIEILGIQEEAIRMNKHVSLMPKNPYDNLSTTEQLKLLFFPEYTLIRLFLAKALVSTLIITLYRPIRMIHRQSSYDSIKKSQILKQIADRFLPSFGIYLLLFITTFVNSRIMGIGAVLLVILTPVGYIVSARKESIFSAMFTSFKWIKDTHKLIALVVALKLLTMPIGTITARIMLAIYPNLSVGNTGVQVVNGLLLSTFGFLVFLFKSSIFVKIEDYEDHKTQNKQDKQDKKEQLKQEYGLN